MGETSPVSAIEAIEKAMEGVTPGPWHVAESGLGNKMKAPTVYHAGDDLNYVASFADFMTFHGPTRNLENARYIAACNPVAIREVLALASQAEALQRENAELREALRPFADVVERAETAAEYFGACHVEEVDDSRPYGLTGTTWGDLRRARALLGGENAE